MIRYKHASVFRSGLVFLLFAITASLTCNLLVGQSLPTEKADTNTSLTKPLRIEETTAEFSRVVAQVESLIKKHGVDQVLLVIDLDNTLLAMNQDLGSDQWYTWQDKLRKTDPSHPALVAKTLDGLLKAQGILFELSSMHPPEPNLPTLVNGLLDQGVTSVVLTSRGKEFRNQSERELNRFEYGISKSTLTIKEKRGVFFPYNAKHPRAHGLSAEIIQQIGKPRAVTYSDGIFMTAGQHKGYMLRTLLARTVRAHSDNDPYANFSAIVFVDDHVKHTRRVHEAFRDSPIDLATFRYSREDGNVQKFKDSTKQHVIRDWKLLKSFVDAVLVHPKPVNKP